MSCSLPRLKKLEGGLEREKPLRIFICGEGDSQVRCVLTRRHFRAAKGTLVPSWTLRIFFHPYLQGEMPVSYQ